MKPFTISLLCFFVLTSSAQSTWKLHPTVPFVYDEVTPFSEQIAAVIKNGKWGYIDETGAPITKFIYSDARPFEQGVAAVEKNGLWYFIDKTGIEFENGGFDKVNYYDAPLIKVKKDGKWGAFDKQLNQIIPFEHHIIFHQDDNLIKVERKFGYTETFMPHVCILNYAGDTIIPMDYYSIKYTGGYFLCAKNLGERNLVKAFFSKEGKQLTKFRYAETVLEEFSDEGTIIMTRKLDDKTVLLDKDLNEIQELIYGGHGNIIISPREDPTVYGVYNTIKSEWTIAPEYNDLEFLLDNETLIFEKAGKKGLIKINGRVLITADFDEAYTPESRYNFYPEIVLTKGDKLGFYDKNSRFFSGIIYPKGNYNDIYFNENDLLVLVRENSDTWMLMDTFGKVISKNLVCGDYPKFTNNRLALQGPNGKWGFVHVRN